MATFDEVSQFFEAVATGLLVAGIAWLVYLALEPYARRFWPHVLISWTRLLSGRIRDPLVGRDLLVGILSGAAIAVFALLTIQARGWFGGVSEAPERRASSPWPVSASPCSGSSISSWAQRSCPSPCSS